MNFHRFFEAVVILVIGLTITACGGGGTAPAPPPPDTVELQQDSSIREPVSIASVGNGNYAIADYRTLRIWNQASRAFTLPTLVKPAAFDARIPGALTDHWNPTGVHVHGGRLYVANYNFHDVLVFSISPDASQLTLTGVLAGLVSPENVVASDDGVAVADYGASGVFFFSPQGDLLWKDTTLASAHGVAMDGSYVYVTCLGAGKLHRYTLAGQAVPVSADFSDLLYPTQISAFDDGKGHERLAIIDANRGTLSTYDASLAKLGQIGHLGPDLFDRPYGFARTDDAFLVADTKNHRLVMLGSDGTALATYPLLPVTQLGTSATWGNGYAYCSDSQLAAPVFSSQFVQFAGFDILCTQVKTGVSYSQILLPHARASAHALIRPDPGFAFSWQGELQVDGSRYWLIGSPSIDEVMVFQDSAYVFTTHDPLVSVWSVAGAESYLADVVRQSAPALARYRQLSQACSPLFAFLDAGGARDLATLDEELEAIVEYPDAKAQVDLWLAGASLYPQPLEAAGRLQPTLAEWFVASGPTSFDDLTLLTLLTRTNAAGERAVYARCHP